MLKKEKGKKERKEMSKIVGDLQGFSYYSGLYCFS